MPTFTVAQAIVALAGVIASVLTAIAASYVWERRIRDRISTSRVKSHDDPDSAGVLELYSRYFPDDGTNLTAAELFDYSVEGPGDRHVRVEEIVLAARFHGAVVGFIFCYYYPDRRKAFVSYFAIDHEVLEARQAAAFVLLQQMFKILRRADRPCEYVFFDLERPDPSLDKKENSQRRGRAVLFRLSARRLGLRALQFDFPYESPRVSIARDTQEAPLILMAVPIKGAIANAIHRELLLEFLKFIYLDCYGDLYLPSDERFAKHQELLHAKYSSYEQSLPDTIRVH